MNDLDRICSGPAPRQLPLAKLEHACLNLPQSFRLEAVEIGLVVALAVLGLVVLIAHRVKKEESADVVAGNAIEGAVYPALGAYAGTSFGLIAAELMSPRFAGGLFAALAIIALFFAIKASIDGGGAAGWKALGWLALLGEAGGFALVAVMAFAVPGEGPAGPEYQRYLNTVCLAAGIAGGIDGVVVALGRGVHPALGWLLVPINAGWGWLGNLLGLIHHASSWFFYADHGKYNPAFARRFYICYEEGFRLKQPTFAYTAGWVVTARSAQKHEGVHVLQHLIAGPVFVLSYIAWFLLLLVPGLFAGAIVRSAPGAAAKGVNDLSYYNNPWEVMAYAVEKDRHDNAPDGQKLIMNDVAAWIIGIVFILACGAGFAAWLVWRINL